MNNQKHPDEVRLCHSTSHRTDLRRRLRGLALAGFAGFGLVTAAHSASILDPVPAAYADIPGPGYSASLNQPIRSQQVYPAYEFPVGTIRITALRWRRFNSETFAGASGQFRFKLSTTGKSETTLSAEFAQNVGPDETVVFDGQWTVSSPTVDNAAPYPFEMVLNLTTPFEYNSTQGNLLLEHQCFSTSVPWVDAVGTEGDGLARAFNLNLDPNGTTASVIDTGGEIIEFEYTILDSSVFTRITTGGIANDANDSSGAAWGDLNGDGWPDLYVVNFGQPDALYTNKADGTFTRVTGVAPVIPAANGIAASLGDLENDGDLDLFVSNQGADRLYRNDGNGSWTELSDDPTGQDGLVSSSSAWGDYDRDGYLDLAVAMGGGAASTPNRLYHNQGNGTFVRVTTGAVAESTGYNISVSWSDFNDDGKPDLLFTGDNLLFQNEGAGAFTGLTSTPISAVSGFPAGGGWADYDNDGDLDLLIVNLFADPQLYRNDGGGSFTQLAGLGFTGAVAGGMDWGDFDNDGLVDVALAGRNGAPRVFRNNGDGGFSPVVMPVLPEGKGNGVTWVDYDHDGDLDLFIVRGGNTGAIDNQVNLLLSNSGNANGWLSVRLNGSLSNRQGVGARVRVTTQTGGGVVRQVRQLGGGDSYGGTSLTAHFGLGDASQIDLLEVEWPSGVVQNLADVAINQRITINEGDAPISLTLVPNGGTFTNSVQVTILSPTGATTVRYTTDGSNPTASSTVYTGAFLLSQTATVKAQLFVNGFPASEVAQATFTRYVPPDVEFLPAGQFFTNQISVALVNNVGSGSVLRFTTDGSEPTSTSPAYSSPLILTTATTIRARAYFGSFVVSDVFSESYQRVYAFENDGIPFAWREQYFGPDFLTDPCAAADADCDGDRFSVLEEYQRNTNPTVREIVLTVRSVPRLTFSTIAGQSYLVQRAISLDPADWQTISDPILATGSELHFVDETAPDNSYYRVERVNE